MQTILGASGTIGRLLAGELLNYTDKIRLVSRNPKKINENDELIAADLFQPGAIDRAVEGSEIVYLVVGLEYKLKVWEEKWPLLIKGTIDACVKHNARLVFFDNVYMYDKDYISGMTEETPVNPPSKKGKVRKQVNDMLFQAARDRNLQMLIARSADFYGPGNENSFLTQMVLKNIAVGKKAMWFAGPDFKHSFTYTPDAAKATALLGNTPDAYGEVWHLPTDERKISGHMMITMVASEMGKEAGITIVPKWMLYILGIFVPVMREMPEMMYQYDRDYFFDSSRFTKRFGIKATPYEEGVKVVCREFLSRK
jgi:nucleoside-diphosphate-sugar epimerase